MATTIADLLTRVYAITNRPGLVTETTSAVKKATMKLHCMDFWKQDLSAAQIVLPVQTIARYQIDTSTAVELPLFRRAEYIREYASPLTGREYEFEMLDANNIMDGYNLEKYNYWVQVGLAINLVASKILGTITVGYYKYPNVTDGGYSSWIANQFPDAIAEEAARNIFKMIGKDEEHARYEVMTKENEAMVRMIGL